VNRKTPGRLYVNDVFRDALTGHDDAERILRNMRSRALRRHDRMAAARCLLQALALGRNTIHRRIRLLRRYLRECASPLAALTLQKLEEERGNAAGARWAATRGFVLKIRLTDKPTPLASDSNDEWFLARALNASPVIVEMYAPERVRKVALLSATAEVRMRRERAKSHPSVAAFQWLGLAHERVGQVTAALRAYRRAASLAQSGRRKAQYESLMQKIRVLGGR
jgi:hypothetical protein